MVSCVWGWRVCCVFICRFAHGKFWMLLGLGFGVTGCGCFGCNYIGVLFACLRVDCCELLGTAYWFVLRWWLALGFVAGCLAYGCDAWLCYVYG